MYEDNEKAVLLQTVKATAFNLLNRDKQMDLQVVFDCGSQCSYVTDRVSRTLALEPHGRRTMSIAAFGAKETRRVCHCCNRNDDSAWPRHGVVITLFPLSVHHCQIL